MTPQKPTSIRLIWSSSSYGTGNPAKSYILCRDAMFGPDYRPVPGDLYCVSGMPMFNTDSIYLEYEITGNNNKQGASLRIKDFCSRHGSKPHIGHTQIISTERIFITEKHFGGTSREARRNAKEAAQQHLDNFMKQLFPTVTKQP